MNPISRENQNGQEISGEKWMDATGFEDVIEVSNMGRIRSKVRIISFSDGKPPRTIGGKILAQQSDSCGYLRARISAYGTKATIKVHRIVASAFVKNEHEKPQVNHKDGNKQNNASSNLEWVTNSENQFHANESGLRSSPKGCASPRYKGDIYVFNSEGIHVATIKTRDEMRNMGFDYRLVSACVLGKRNEHKGHAFKRIGNS